MSVEIALVRTLWQLAAVRYHALRAQPRDAGATALEWAVISAILVTAAVVIGGIIYKTVQDKGKSISDCANKPVGADGC